MTGHTCSFSFFFCHLNVMAIHSNLGGSKYLDMFPPPLFLNLSGISFVDSIPYGLFIIKLRTAPVKLSKMHILMLGKL